jgi:hypothetical protein
MPTIKMAMGTSAIGRIPINPSSKNWMYNSFGSDALTFEVHDELSVETIRQLGVHSAESLMQILLDDWNRLQSSNQ